MTGERLPLPRRRRVVDVDPGTCVGSATCIGVIPQSITLGADGKAVVVDPGAHADSEVEEAIDSCPVGAIRWWPLGKGEVR